jgi:hypothetical protein
MWVPGRAACRKLALPAAVAGLIALAFCWGRSFGQGPPADGSAPLGIKEARPAWSVTSPENAGRPVAYIYNNIPVTREELGDYLIARYGPERVDFLVNRRIIDRECQARGIYVTDAEVEAQLVEDLRSMGVTRTKDFVNQILNRFHKTLYEYKEDVIRPKLAMIKLVRPTITIEEKDLQDAFEAHYGPKVHCRMIVLPKEMNGRQKQEVWTRASKSADDFDRESRAQFVKALASTGGEAPPVHRHFGDERIENVAFGLKPGELSQVLDMKDGTAVILKCVEHLPPDTTRRMEDERLKLHRECMEVRLLQKIPEYFQKLRADADPRVFLRRDDTPDEAIRRADAQLQASAREAQRQQAPAALPAGAAAPLQGN